LEFNVPFQHKYGYIRDEHCPVVYLLIYCSTSAATHYFCLTSESLWRVRVTDAPYNATMSFRTYSR